MAITRSSIFLGLIISVILLIPTTALALTVEEVTNPQTTSNTWVTDMADILSNKTEAKLNRQITNLEQSSGAEIAVVTVPETAPAESPKAFATQLFNYWGIGKAESDNGILFLISTADRRVEIETGYGIENILPDAKVSEIIDRNIMPQYKQDNYDRGTLDGIKALIDPLNDLIAKASTLEGKDNSSIISIFANSGFVFLGLFLVMFLLRETSRQVLVDPHKTVTSKGIHYLDRQDFYNICCAKCTKPMKKVDDIELTKVQQVAKKIGSTSYQGYKCSDCNQDNPLQPYTIVAYTSSSSRYQKCPECKDLTVTRTAEIVSQRDYDNEGEKKIKDICNCCKYTLETTKSIPRKRHSTDSSDSSSSYSGSSSSGGFGGGSSDGGGAGGSW